MQLSAQELFWYDVLLEVSPKDYKQAEQLMDDYYSSIEMPEGVSVTISRMPLRPASEPATHIISIVGMSSEKLANFRTSLSGDKWDAYVSQMSSVIHSARASSGRSFMEMNMDMMQPLGQAWLFRVDDRQGFITAFQKLMTKFKPDGFVSMGQINHGVDNGENMYIYATSPNLQAAFEMGPKTQAEQRAFEDFFEATEDGSDFIRSFTRVEIKTYKK